MSKTISPIIADFMVHASKNLFNAAQAGDSDLAEATLVNLLSVLPSYIQAIQEEG